MNLYEYKKENGKYTRTKVKTLVPGTPEYKFYERFMFIEEKWYDTQKSLEKYGEESAIGKSMKKKIEILERDYDFLGDFEKRPVYDIKDTIEEMKRMNIILVKFIEELMKTMPTDSEMPEATKAVIVSMLENVKAQNPEIDIDITSPEAIELIDKMVA